MGRQMGTEPTDPVSVGRVASKDEGKTGDEFVAPLGASKHGRLRFVGGAHRVIILAGSDLRALYRARFGERTPAVAVRRGAVTIRFPRFPAEDWLDHWSGRPAEVELSARIPWDIEVRGGASRITADLRQLRLRSFYLEGGAARLEVALPRPAGAVVVRLLGGASNVDVSRPDGVAARLRVEGGATNLGFDERRVGAAGGGLDLESGGYDGAADRYDVFVAGGANSLHIGERRGRGRSWA